MIRRATEKDLLAIGKVHSACFPDSYITQLGKVSSSNNNLLVRFYQEFINDAPELFWIADDEEIGIVGFCMGYYMDKDDQMKNFIKRNRISVAIKTILLLLLCNKQTWNKIFSIFRKGEDTIQKIVDFSNEHIKNDKRGDLLSVCILPEFRGNNVSQQLMEAFLIAMKESGRELCLLSVRTDNNRAINFYERNGFKLYRVRGSEGRTYMKLL